MEDQTNQNQEQPPAANPQVPAKPQGTEPTGKKEEQHIPLSRLNAVNEKLAATKTALEAEQAKANALSARLAELEGGANTLKFSHDALKAAITLGITDEEGVEVAKTLYTAAKPAESFPDWLKAQVSGERPNRALAAYLPNQGAPQPKPATAPPPPTHSPPQTAAELRQSLAIKVNNGTATPEERKQFASYFGARPHPFA